MACIAGIGKFFLFYKYPNLGFKVGSWFYLALSVFNLIGKKRSGPVSQPAKSRGVCELRFCRIDFQQEADGDAQVIEGVIFRLVDASLWVNLQASLTHPFIAFTAKDNHGRLRQVTSKVFPDFFPLNGRQIQVENDQVGVQFVDCHIF